MKAMSVKKLSFITMMAVCMGLVVVQGAMVSVLQGIGIGGLGFIVALLIAFCFAQCNALSFAELALMFPSSGTLATYTQKAMGHFLAIIAVFSGYVVVAMFGLSAELLLVDALLSRLFPDMFPPMLIPLLILVSLTGLNILGMDIFAKLQNLFTFTMIIALLLVGITAVTGLGEPIPADFVADVNWGFESIANGQFLSLIAMAMWLVVGIEFICPMINDVRNPKRNLPRVMILSLVIILTIFIIFCFGASRYLSVKTLTESPLPHLDYVFAVFGKYGTLIATIMALTATCSTVNTVLASVSRMMLGMAENGQAFPQLKLMNKRFNTPWLAIVFVAFTIALPFVLLNEDYIITLLISASISWLLAYIIAHINVIILRMRNPELARPFRSPWFPLPQAIGIIGMSYVIIHNSPSPDMTKTVYLLAGFVLLIVAVISALWVKLVMKKPLFKPD